MIYNHTLTTVVAVYTDSRNNWFKNTAAQEARIEITDKLTSA